MESQVKTTVLQRRNKDWVEINTNSMGAHVWHVEVKEGVMLRKVGISKI